VAHLEAQSCHLCKYMKSTCRLIRGKGASTAELKHTVSVNKFLSWVCTYKSMYVYLCTRLYVRIYIYVCMHVCMHACKRERVRACVRACLSTHILLTVCALTLSSKYLQTQNLVTLYTDNFWIDLLLSKNCEQISCSCITEHARCEVEHFCFKHYNKSMKLHIFYK
jgi:hypothetical protein